jgi:hypothetical protein
VKPLGSNFVAIACSLLALAAGAVWVRSHFTRDRLTIRPGHSSRLVQISSDHGSLGCVVVWSGDPEIGPWGARLQSDGVTQRSTHDFWGGSAPFAGRLDGGQWTIRGFGFIFDRIPRLNAVFVLAPFWFIAVSIGVVPSRWLLIRLRQRMRLQRGLCLRCAYDLRGSIGSGRCPECGTPSQVPTVALFEA